MPKHYKKYATGSKAHKKAKQEHEAAVKKKVASKSGKGR